MAVKTYIALAAMTAILVLILMPVDFHINIPNWDKYAHFFFSGLAALALSTFVSVRKAVLIAFMILTAAELSQHYIPNRAASLGDFLANTGGILGFWFLASQGWLTNMLKSIKLRLS